MRIGLDARTIFTSEITGVGKYVLKLCEGFQQCRHTLVLFTTTSDQAPAALDMEAATVAATPSYNRYTWEQFVLPKLLKQYPVDVYHATWNFGIPFGYKGKAVTTIHDIIPFMLPQLYRNSSVIEFLRYHFNSYFIRRAIQQSQRIVTVSEASQYDIQQRFPLAHKKISVVYEGADDFSSNPDDQFDMRSIKREYRITDQYFLYTSGFEKRKNVRRLIEAHRRLYAAKPLQLVLVGKKNEYYHQHLAQEHHQGLVFTDYVPETTLKALFQHALALVYPSYYEGFGLPIVQAMAAGLPVIANNTPSLREVGGDAVFFVNANNADELYNGMSTMVGDEQLRKMLREKGFQRAKRFRWDKMVEQHEQIYRSIIMQR